MDCNLGTTDLNKCSSFKHIRSGNTTGTLTSPTGYKLLNGYIFWPYADFSEKTLSGGFIDGGQGKVDLTGADFQMRLIKSNI